jgi:poly(3-hydroxybutyrate) depolymerase
MYDIYQAQEDLLGPLRLMARGTSGVLRTVADTRATAWPLRHAAALLDLVGNARLTHHRPPFAIDAVKCGNRLLPVREEVVDVTPFGTLLRFAKDSDVVQPRVLVAAPMSGHFATLLRGTVETMLPDHEVFITDWHNARDVPLAAGDFGFDDYVAHVIHFLECIGPGAHVIAVCQPAVAVLAAAAVMAANGNRAQPRSMTLMAGPIDTRVNATQVNALACSKPIDWFERKLITRVPWRYAGAGRRVYPGATQLTAFLAMNLDRHVQAHVDQFRHLVDGNQPAAIAHRRFYEEYLAVMDLPAEFYLETVRLVFQEHALPRGELHWRGEKVRPAAIRRTAQLTVEGEKDDICGLGQTMAALDLCSGIRPAMRRHHLQTGAGHYGVFNGRRWQQEIYPKVRALIQEAGG